MATAKKKTTKKKAARRKVKPAYDAAADHNRLMAIKTHEKALSDIENDLAESKGETKRLRDAGKMTLIELRKIVSGEDTLDQPLVDFIEKDGWRKVTIAFAVASPKYGDQLQAGGCGTTLGQLQAFLEDHTLYDVVGISETDQEEIADRLEAFWDRNPQWTEPVPTVRAGL